jgi:hypothetical protein
MVGHGVFSVAAVQIVTRESGLIAQIFPPCPTIAADTASEAEPGDAEPLPLGYPPDRLTHTNDRANNLMSGNQRKF